MSALTEFVEVRFREFPLITAVVDASIGDAAVAERVETNPQRFIDDESVQVIEAAQARSVLRADLLAPRDRVQFLTGR
ncbi:hypothetical protein AB0H49_20690 [Nocardia sp. NPDC050713]|uniref:hypothetical protein n=1 Tax=Nocardia sp. NPDC050713 TaxID=3154511 RepID=UPI0033FFC9D2